MIELPKLQTHITSNTTLEEAVWELTKHYFYVKDIDLVEFLRDKTITISILNPTITAPDENEFFNINIRYLSDSDQSSDLRNSLYKKRFNDTGRRDYTGLSVFVSDSKGNDITDTKLIDYFDCTIPDTLDRFGIISYKFLINNPFLNDELRDLYKEISSIDNSHAPTGVARLCFRDKERTAFLMNEVYMLTDSGQRVIDLGAGTGVLGFAAFLAGAYHVTFVDNDPQNINFIRCVASSLGYERGSYRVEKKDAKSVKLPMKKPYDHVICEIIGTGLIGEDQVRVIKNVQKYVTEDVLYTPLSATSYIELVDDKGNPLTDQVVYDNLVFSDDLPDGINTVVEVKVIKDGIAKIAHICTELGYESGNKSRELGSLCKPRELMLSLNGEKFVNVAVKTGDTIKLGINYEYGVRHLPYIQIVESE